MATLDVFILLSLAQKLPCELLIKERFGWQVDDVLSGRTEDDEQILKFAIGSQDEQQYETFIRLLEQQKEVGAISDFQPKTAFLASHEKNGTCEHTGASRLEQRVALAEELLSFIETGWMGQELGPEQLALIQDALQEYMDRREVLLSNSSSDTCDLSLLIRQAQANIALYIDDPEEQCDLSPLSTALSQLELALQTIEKAATVTGGEAGEDDSLFYYQEEVIVLTDEEVLSLCAVSEIDPWADQGSEAHGPGNLLAAKYWDDPYEGLTIPAGVRGERRLGWWIDGAISDQILHHLSTLLDNQRMWRAWPNSDFALVLPDASYEQPLDDPLLVQLVQVLSLKEAFHTLQDMSLTFVGIYEGFLIVKNAKKQYEVWWRLPDDGVIIGESSIKLEYWGDLYCLSFVEDDMESVWRHIQHELKI